MRFVIAMLLFVVCCRLQAQSSNWPEVESLPPGTRVTITTFRNTPCTINSVSDNGMECIYRGVVWWVERERIRRVKLFKTTGAVIGTLVGAAATGTAAGVTDHSSIPASSVVRVGIITAAGGFAGYLIGHIADAHKGEVIYQAP